MQLITADLFRDFPTLRFIIPHGGGAVPYHWGRYRGMAQDLKRPPLAENLLDNVFFDTCVYHDPGIELLLKVIPSRTCCSPPRWSAPSRGRPHNRSQLRRHQTLPGRCLAPRGRKRKIFEGNARRVYRRMKLRG